MAKVTIFGLAGTGTSTTGKRLAEELQVPFISSGNIFRKKAAELNMSLLEFEAFTEKNPEFDNILDNELAEYGRSHAAFIIESRLAWHFIPDSIKIKLDCDFDARVQRVADRDGLTFDQAKAETLYRETKALKHYKDLYGIELYTDDAHFDHVIDTTHISVDEVISKIRSFIV